MILDISNFFLFWKKAALLLLKDYTKDEGLQHMVKLAQPVTQIRFTHR